jgi:ferric-dicitrate binding protein FerR (iron transport regulator)
MRSRVARRGRPQRAPKKKTRGKSIPMREHVDPNLIPWYVCLRCGRAYPRYGPRVAKWKEEHAKHYHWFQRFSDVLRLYSNNRVHREVARGRWVIDMSAIELLGFLGGFED